MNTRPPTRWIASALLFSLFASPILAADTPADSIHISGTTLPSPSDWTPARLKSDLASDIKTVNYTSHNQPHHSNCVPLLSLLKAAGLDPTLKHDPSIDPHKKHIQLRLAVTVIGHDGYASTFSLAELLPDAGNREVFLALHSDDQPLSPSDAPAKLLVPSDAKPGRWVHSVTSILITDPTPSN